jgi:hypothetical protein
VVASEQIMHLVALSVSWVRRQRQSVIIIDSLIGEIRRLSRHTFRLEKDLNHVSSH